MKLRIQSQSIRLRLGEDDIAMLLDKGRVTGSLPSVPGPGPAFEYCLELGVSAVRPALRVTARGIRIVIPRTAAMRLAEGSGDALDQEISGGRQSAIRLRVERDEPDSCPAKATGRRCPLRNPS